MEILPTSPISIPAREANPLSAMPKELIKPEKENFSLGQEETKLTTTETRKELPTDGPNAQSLKPDFPYSLVAGVTFPLQNPIAPVGASTDELTGDVAPNGENLSLDPTTAFPKPIALGAPSDDAASMSAKWQKIGPNIDFAKLSPEFAAQSEKLSTAIRDFKVPGFGQEIDLTSFWGGNNAVQANPLASILPNAFPDISVVPNNNSNSTAISLAELPTLPGAPTSVTYDSAILSYGVGNFTIGADLTAADLLDPKKLNPVPVPVEELPTISNQVGQPKKLNPIPVPVEELPTVSNEVGRPKKLDPIPVPVEEIPTVTSVVGQPKKLDPVPVPVEELPQTKKLDPIRYPVEEIPTVTSVSGQQKKLEPIPYPVIETLRSQKDIDSSNGMNWGEVETVESNGSSANQISVVKAGSKDEWNWNSDSSDSVWNSLGLDPDASQAVAGSTISKSEFGVSKSFGIGEFKTDQKLPDEATKRLVEVVADRLEAIAAAKPRNGVTIQLRPFDLGSITMIIKNSGNEVGAELFASHDSVRQALDQNRAMLSQHLEMKGMHLASVTVTDSSLSNSTSTFAEQNAQRTLQQNSNQTSTVRFAETDPIVDPIQLLRKGKTDGVDYWI